MEMEKKRIQSTVQVLLVLLMVNYMIGTVLLRDFFAFKYLRELIVFGLLFVLLLRNRLYLLRADIWAVLFLVIGAAAILGSTSVGAGVQAYRRYIFPLALFLVVRNMNAVSDFSKFSRFWLYFIFILSAWGIFQADILGDGILRKMGYPLVYSYYYQRDMLYDSFYFGGLGIQRVVSTLSSSNIFGLVAGVSLIFFIVFYKRLEVKGKNLMIVVVAMAYLLSFSRSNFLAMLVVVLLWAWKFVPYKRQLCIAGGFMLLLFLAVGIYQGDNGLLYKLANWVHQTFTLQDSSAAGRSGIWQTALQAVIAHPLGIGYGHVGGLADMSNPLNEVYSAENSYLTIALDTGWLGLLCYLIFWFLLIGLLRANARQFKKAGDDFGYRLSTCGYTVLIYLMIVMLFSNHIQDMEVISLVYVLVGMACGYRILQQGQQEQQWWQEKPLRTKMSKQVIS